MNEIIIDKNSWHYRLAREFYGVHLGVTHNFCEYWRKVIFSIFMLLLLIFFVIFFISMVVISIIIGIVNPYPSGLIFFMMYSVTFAVFYRAYKLDKKDSNNENDNSKSEKKTTPNIFWIKYKSWKDKICPVVKFK